VLRVLEREGVPIHVAAGTSMGSVIGGLYALGVGVDSLAALATTLDWEALFTDRVERSYLSPDQRAFDDRNLVSLPFAEGRVRLPSGAVEGAAIQRLLARLTWPAASVRDFSRLPRPFAALATDLETGEAVPITRGVLADALRASMAIPGLIEPLLSNGRLLVDGALARNLPADDARALGADVVICSDVSDPLDRADQLVSLVDVLMQTASFRMNASTLEQRERCDVLIQPDIEGLSALDFDEAAEWIRRGEVAAERAVATLRGLASRGAPLPESLRLDDGRPDFPGRLPDSIRIARLQLVGVRTPAADWVRRTVDVDRRSMVSAGRLDEAMEDLYAGALIGTMRYRIDAAEGDAVLTVQADSRARDEVGLGIRYDDQQRAAILFTATLYDWLQFGSATRLDARLGEELQFRGSYLSGRAVTGSLSLGAEVGWSQSPLDVYDGSQRVARTELEVTSVVALVGLAAQRGSLVALELRGERAVGSTAVAANDTTVPVWLGSAAISFLRESYDRPDFPRGGGRTYLRSEFGVTTVAAGGAFSHHVLDIDRRLPLHPRITALFGAHLGYAGGRDVPTHRRFFAGGDHRSPIYSATQPTFAGQSRQAGSGNAVQIWRAGVQFEPMTARFLTVAMDAGTVAEAWRLEPDTHRFGWALSAGATSIVGPLSVTLTGGHGDLQWSFNVGRRF
jgi:NTE family protein